MDAPAWQLLQTEGKYDTAAKKSMQTVCRKLLGSESLIVIEFLNELDRSRNEDEDPSIDVEDLVCELELQRLCKETFAGLGGDERGVDNVATNVHTARKLLLEEGAYC